LIPALLIIRILPVIADKITILLVRMTQRAMIIILLGIDFDTASVIFRAVIRGKESNF